jgi:hypothetical protein
MEVARDMIVMMEVYLAIGAKVMIVMIIMIVLMEVFLLGEPSGHESCLIFIHASFRCMFDLVYPF